MKYIISPRKLFLIDALGAFVTAFLIGIVLRRFQAYIGMPSDVLGMLSIFALIFCVYSTAIYRLAPVNWKIFLKGIIAANISYCLLTFVLMIYYYGQLTVFGIIYFTGEIIIVYGLVMYEVRILKINNRFD